MGWWLNAKPGDRVVCVVDWDFLTKLAALGDGIRLPLVGVTYTIREIIVRFDQVCLRLEEIQNEVMVYGDLDHPDEQSFLASRFKPLQPLKTDISVFAAMLTVSPAKADA